MSDKIIDAGPAFPTEVGPYGKDFQSSNERWHAIGMSLRDYFAAKAMQAIMSTPKPEFHTSADDVSMMAYQMADAMIKARQS